MLYNVLMDLMNKLKLNEGYVTKINSFLSNGENKWGLWNRFSTIFEVYEQNESNIFVKYDYIYKINREIDEEDVEILHKIENKEHNIFIRFFIHYLFAISRNHRKHSKLTEICKEYMNFYFKNINGYTDFFGVQNLVEFVATTVYKFKEFKRTASEILFKNYMDVIDDKIEHLRSLQEINRILSHKKLGDIFSREQLIEIYEKIVKVEKVDSSVATESYNLLTLIMGTSAIKEDRDELKKVKKRLCDFFLENTKSYTKPIDAIEKAYKIKSLMDELKCYKNKSYYKIGFTKNRNKERIIDSCRSRGYTSRKKGEKMKSLFSLLNDLDVMRKKSLIEIGEGLEKATLLNSCQLVIINGNKNKEIVSVKTPTKEDKSLCFFKSKAQDFIFQEASKTRIQLRTIKAVHNIKKTVRKIIFESQLATSKMKEKLVKIFVTCIRSKFKEKFEGLLIVLEKTLRDYFEHQGYSIEETSSNKYISLRHIFKDDEANEYKQELLKFINENFFFTLGWLLVDGKGGDLRNKIIHSYDEVTEHEVKYAVLLILKLYWAFAKK